MSLKCKIGIHNWDGCRCTQCDKTRDNQHDWNQNCEKCSKCGKTLINKHQWDDDTDKCKICGKTNPDTIRETQFVIYPQKPVSVFDLGRWQGRPIKYEGKVVGNALAVALKTDGRLVITTKLHKKYVNKTLGVDLRLQDN